MKSSRFFTTLLVFSLIYAATYSDLLLKLLRDWLTSEAEGLLTNLRTAVGGIGTTVLTAYLVTAIRSMGKTESAKKEEIPVSRVDDDDDHELARWQEAYHELKIWAENAIQEHYDRLLVSQRRRRLLLRVIITVFLLSLGSYLATLFVSPDSESPSRHPLALMTAYAVVTLFMGFITARDMVETSKIPLIIGGFATFLVNFCSLIITLPYMHDTWFGGDAKEVFSTQIGVVIIILRLVALPLVGMAAAWTGCFLQRITRPS